MPGSADSTDSAALLLSIGYSEQKIRALREAGAVQ
jgi:hypothetical protein